MQKQFGVVPVGTFHHLHLIQKRSSLLGLANFKILIFVFVTSRLEYNGPEGNPENNSGLSLNECGVLYNM